MKKLGLYSLILMILTVITSASWVEVKPENLHKTKLENSSVLEKWQTYSSEKVSTPNSKLSSAIIVRPACIKGKVVNVYIDREYQASLLEGAFAQEMVCPGVHQLKLVLSDAMMCYRDKAQRSQEFVFEAGKKYYFKIVNSKSGLKLEALTQAEVEEFFKKSSLKQRHTISRVNKKECDKPAPLPTKTIQGK